MELHLRIPPERWCITIAEFYAFVREVRRVWAAGQVPEGEPGSNPQHGDPQHGPNLYQVNEHYVKPLTRAAGNMSYALMKHPEGLLCQVFISHAWAEGLFELSDLVYRGWPRLQRLNHLYCCLLANPQNLDIGALLDVPPEESPFAKAMQAASHVLVIPNDTVSIYTRLWCVFEAYLGTRWHKTCIMPARPRRSVQCSVAMRTLLVPCVVGLLVGGVWMLSCSRSCMHCFVNPVLVACVMLTLVCFLSSLAMECWSRPVRMWVKCIVIRSVHILVTCACAAVVVPYSAMTRWGDKLWSHLFQRLIPVALCLFNMSRTAQLNQHHLEDAELNKQASFLAIQTLEDATCSDPHDEEKIRQAIQGFEAEVDVTIRVLMRSGAYNDALRAAYENGEDISGSGNSDCIVKTGLVTLIWLLSTLDSAGFLESYVKCRDGAFHKGFDGLFVLGLAVAVQASALFLFPITAWHLQLSGLERVSFAVKVWALSTLIGHGLPLLLEIQLRLLVFHTCGGAKGTVVDPLPDRCDSWDRWLIVAFLRPLSAVVALTCATVGPCYRRCGYRGELSTEPEPSDTESAESSEDSQ
ncbi:unnamed protein product [Symbiodinium natans]|uniref:Uncharacterized protein n=1 Tax=Symbiodinium natans TaxID=878477 RepID=A0A812PFZ1_9DINO|nr:unnamed protein product [Symbiodinium natans]